MAKDLLFEIGIEEIPARFMAIVLARSKSLRMMKPANECGRSIL